MSGFYNVWPKVLNPDRELPQMTSASYQPPFYFGGSQVPTALGIDKHVILANIKGRRRLKGIGIQETDVDRISNKHLPRHLPSLKK